MAIAIHDAHLFFGMFAGQFSFPGLQVQRDTAKAFLLKPFVSVPISVSVAP